IAEAQADAQQLVVDHLANACSLLYDDERLGAQLVARDRAPGESVARWAREDHGVVEERLVLDTTMPRRGADDPELGRPAGDPVDDRLRVVDAERDVQRLVRLGELAEDVGEHDATGAGRCADLEGPLEV